MHHNHSNFDGSSIHSSRILRGLTVAMLCVLLGAPWAAVSADEKTADEMPATEMSATEMSATEMTADLLVAKHRAARGGDGWDAIQSMTLRGDFTAFSKKFPFVQHRTAEGGFYFDHQLDEKQVIMGFDGETPWWVHGWFGTWATRVSGLDRSVFLQDVDFPNVFFHLDDDFVLEYKGEGEIDGIAALVLSLTRPDGWEETWYFDPDTYLELARESKGSDFGQPAAQLTIFDDFRQVEGVMVPFFVESQWYTRDRIIEVSEVEINGAIDAELFRMPSPTGMGELLPLAGTWNVKVESRQQPNGPFEESEMQVEITPRLRGAMLELTYTSPDDRQVVSQLSYDRFADAYRWVTIDDITTYMDVQEGPMEDGKLTVSNSETNTRFETFGFTIKERTTLSGMSSDGFEIEVENSMDGGENWFVSNKMAFTRP